MVDRWFDMLSSLLRQQKVSIVSCNIPLVFELSEIFMIGSAARGEMRERCQLGSGKLHGIAGGKGLQDSCCSITANRRLLDVVRECFLLSGEGSGNIRLLCRNSSCHRFF